MYTLKEMLDCITTGSNSLTPQANAELVQARLCIFAEFKRQRHTFIAERQQVPRAGELYDLASPMSLWMPAPGNTLHPAYYVQYGMLFGMVIAQLNWCLETSECPEARRAAIDYIRRMATHQYGINFA